MKLWERRPHQISYHVSFKSRNQPAIVNGGKWLSCRHDRFKSIQSYHGNPDALLIFYHALSEIITVPLLAAWLPLSCDVKLSSVTAQEKTCPTSFRHTSATEMSHRVSPSRVSWLFATLQRLSPACCVCPMEEKMKQCLTIISKAQTQEVWPKHMQTHWLHYTYTFSFCVLPFVWWAVTLSLCHFWHLFYDSVCPRTLTRPDI